MTASEARDALIGASEGTFLVRDSSHPLYLFTLSVQTWRGPTNVRIEYDSGRFRLDSSFPARSSLLSFSALPSLMQHYTSMSQEEEEDSRRTSHGVKGQWHPAEAQEASVQASGLSNITAAHTSHYKQPYRLPYTAAAATAADAVLARIPLSSVRTLEGMLVHFRGFVFAKSQVI